MVSAFKLVQALDMELKNREMIVVKNAMMMASGIIDASVKWNEYLIVLSLCYDLPQNPVLELRKRCINQDETGFLLPPTDYYIY